MNTETPVPPHVAATKEWRRLLDAALDCIRCGSDRDYTGIRPPDYPVRSSRERSITITKLQEAIMWLGMDLKAQGTANPYPNSYNPESPVIEPTSDGLKL
jgi:hypothetical protein